VNKPLDPFRTKVRIKDIAERANVSVGTVDRVLHNRGEVAQETRDLINKIIEELEYKPNIIASVLAMKKPFRIGVLMPLPVEKDSYWTLHLMGIEAAVKEISHFGVSIQKYFYEITSDESLRLQYDQLLENNPDAVLMVPAFGETGNFITKELQEKNIPYSFIDTKPQNAGSPISFSGQNSFQSGYLAAKLMSYGVSKETTVLIVNVGSDIYSEPHHLSRVQGFKAYLSEYNITETKVRIIDIPSTQDQDVKNALTTAFYDYSFVRGMFVTGHEVHKVAKFVDDKKLGNIRMIGYDLLESNIHYLKRGTIDFLISQKPESQGFKGVMALFNSLVLKQPISPEMPMPIDIITKENVDFYLYL